jgi:hypothetical protein
MCIVHRHLKKTRSARSEFRMLLISSYSPRMWKQGKQERGAAGSGGTDAVLLVEVYDSRPLAQDLITSGDVVLRLVMFTRLVERISIEFETLT